MKNAEKREFLRKVLRAQEKAYNLSGWIFPVNSSETFCSVCTELKIPLTPGEIISIRNLEVRRKQVDLVYGGDYKKLIKALGTARTIEKTVEKTEQGELIHLGTPSGQGSPLRFVKVKDGSSDREYILRVPNRMRTVRGAIAWTFGLRPDQYAPVKET
jgi:hypothetical protein